MDASHGVEEHCTFDEHVSDASSDESGDTFEMRTPVQRVSGLSGLMKLDDYRAENHEVRSRYSSQNLNELFVDETIFNHNFEPPCRRDSLAQFVEASEVDAQLQQIQAEIEEQRVQL